MREREINRKKQHFDSSIYRYFCFLPVFNCRLEIVFVAWPNLNVFQFGLILWRVRLS
jgi:hypothetical protein